MDETTIHASDDAMDASQSLARRRHRLSTRQGAFDNPAPGQNDKARQVGPSDDFDRQPIDVRDGRFELLSGIAAIGEHPGKGGIRVTGSLDQARSPVAVLHIGTVDNSLQHVAQCVGYDVAFTTLDLLARVVAARPARLGGLHRLAVDDACAGFGPAACRDPHPCHQHRVDGIEQAVVAHPVEMILHRREGREVLGQLRPLATGRCDILDHKMRPVCLRGRPTLEVRLNNGRTTAHSSSVQSLA